MDALVERLDMLDTDRIMWLFSENNATKEDVKRFWSKYICFYCSSLKRSFSFTVPELIDDCTTSTARPSYLNLTIMELLKDDKASLANAEDYIIRDDLYLNNNVLRMFSGLSLINKPSVTTCRYISLPLLKEVTDLILMHAESRNFRESIFLRDSCSDIEARFTFAHYLSEFRISDNQNGSICKFIREMSKNDREILLSHLLSSNCALLSKDGKMVQLVKPSKNDGVGGRLTIFSSIATFFGGAASEGTASTDRFISHSDESHLQLRISVSTLEAKVNEMEAKADKHRKRAVEYKAKQ